MSTLKLKLQEENELEFALDGIDPAIFSGAQVRFLISEKNNKNGVGFSLPVQNDQSGNLKLKIPNFPLFEEGVEYLGVVEVISEDKINHQLTMTILFESKTVEPPVVENLSAINQKVLDVLFAERKQEVVKPVQTKTIQTKSPEIKKQLKKMLMEAWSDFDLKV